eukprot:6776802-Pyramimonas_sp.AAC.1
MVIAVPLMHIIEHACVVLRETVHALHSVDLHPARHTMSVKCAVMGIARRVRGHVRKFGCHSVAALEVVGIKVA